MNKFLVLLTSISLATVVSANVVARFPQPKDGGDNSIGTKLDLSLFLFDKIGDKFSFKKDNVIVNNQIDLKSRLTKGIKSLDTTYLPWNEVDITIATINKKTSFKQVYVKMEAKDGAKSFKGSVMLGDLQKTPPIYVNLRPTLDKWQPKDERTLTVGAAGELDTVTFNALDGTVFGKTNLTELGLTGKYDQATNYYTLTADATTSDFFSTSDIVFNVDIK